MSRIIISYALAGMALVMLVGGAALLGHAFKTLLAERTALPEDGQDEREVKPRVSRIPSASVKSAVQ